MTPDEIIRKRACIAIPTTTEQTVLRFESKYSRRKTCWIWNAQLNARGYGVFTINGRHYLAHRISYAMSGKHLDNSMGLDHLCRNPSCINPTHLEPVTQKENVLRGVGPTAVNACKRCHLPSEDCYKDSPGGTLQRRRRTSPD